MSDRIIRELASDYVKDKIDNGIKELERITRQDINYLSIYPLTMLEESLFSSNPATISNTIMRSSISWFLRNFNNLENVPYSNLKFKTVNYNRFKNKIYPMISKIFQDYRTLLEINDHWSYASSKFEKLGDNRWRLLTALVSDQYSVEEFYYNRVFNKQLFDIEIGVANDIHWKFSENMLLKTDGFTKPDFGYDEDLYNACLKRIELDLRFLGNDPRSSIIKNYMEFKKVITALYYISQMKVTANQIKLQITKKIPLAEMVVVASHHELSQKLSEYSMVNMDIVDKILNYLSLANINKGSLFEFPILKLADHYVFNPASILVNDWHFSIVNGHYCKDIDFQNRDKMISSQIVEMLEQETKSIANIKISKEKYYEFYDNNVTSEPKKSDIDFAIYDIRTNKLLVIECKWRSNHYLSEIDYNYNKIHNSLYKIYDDQITKHQGFLIDKNNINFIFDFDEEIVAIKDKPEIEYLIVDKRNQLYLEGRKMMSIYMLITILQSFIKDNVLNLEGLITLIQSLKTKTEYFVTRKEKMFTLEDGTILFSDQLDLKYNFKGV
ncbi:hypothetical protein HMPREF0322_04615 [Desulfitobacterium hafniense DP7]|uniref:Uncharacterized protein n=1 Tax=Desulfitobacterium hafniense DP7 TaxID=537010 RepID=G9XUF6_DESHA|nr:hypothetical protein [Desulfitobacterium hafniense]EHL04714.1 hypothetical protein HMPREF0322_04615 [Desulfitobacterium hafniense DP7]